MQYFRIGFRSDLFQDEFMKLEDYFVGLMDAHGLVMSRSGAVTRSFVVHMDIFWKGDVGTLKEDFEWNDGEKESQLQDQV